MAQNLILLTDSYKASHWRQYPPGTERVYSYFESRGGEWSDVTFFGLQYILKAYLANLVLTRQDVDDAARFAKKHFGNSEVFNERGWRELVDQYGNGRLPIEIRAVPEGTTVPVSNVLITVENTDPRFPWLTNYIESLLVHTWYPCTVTTLARHIRILILKYLEQTGDPSLIDYKLHDFGFRGVSSVESAGIGGAAHLTSFNGTDTMAGIVVAQETYGAEMPAHSIPAAEHSTITAWGPDHEVDAFANMLDQFPTGLVAVVSDSYDIFRACRDHWGTTLKDRVLARDGALVVRPDSGDPAETVLEVVRILAAAFGTQENHKGYRVLDPHVRVIQGDGVNYESIDQVLWALANARFRADNIAFWMGGALLQKLNRDTQRFAFKCSAVTIDGIDHDVRKNPVGDPGKASKGGRLALVRTSGKGWATTTRRDAERQGRIDQLVPVFRNGQILVDHHFDDIRKRARS